MKEKNVEIPKYPRSNWVVIPLVSLLIGQVSVWSILLVFEPGLEWLLFLMVVITYGVGISLMYYSHKRHLRRGINAIIKAYFGYDMDALQRMLNSPDLFEMVIRGLLDANKPGWNEEKFKDGDAWKGIVEFARHLNRNRT